MMVMSSSLTMCQPTKAITEALLKMHRKKEKKTKQKKTTKKKNNNKKTKQKKQKNNFTNPIQYKSLPVHMQNLKFEGNPFIMSNDIEWKWIWQQMDGQDQGIKHKLLKIYKKKKKKRKKKKLMQSLSKTCQSVHAQNLM